MTDEVEHAVSCFKDGFSCSQAVLSAYGEQFGMNREMTLKVSGAFGGDGSSWRNMWCGDWCVHALYDSSMGRRESKTSSEERKPTAGPSRFFSHSQCMMRVSVRWRSH